MATLKDIAEAVGVKSSTVSVVLNGKTTRIKVSERTRKKILDAARRLDYVPNGSAKALATGRSGNLGFILSDQITGGWGNTFFASQLMGFEDRCRELGYGLSISRYNLTNLDTFVFPMKVRRRNVDGLALAGDVPVAVVQRFQEFGVPCVSLGVTPEVAGMVPTVSVNQAALEVEAIAYAYGLGHRRVGLCISPTRRARDVAIEAQRRVAHRPDLTGCEVRLFESSRQSDWFHGEEAFQQWLQLPGRERPTVMLGSDQSMIGFLRAMKEAGLRCPDDISLISNFDQDLCRYSDPPLTAMHCDQSNFGRLAVDLLVNHLDRGQPLSADQSILEPRFELVVRQSCGTVLIS